MSAFITQENGSYILQENGDKIAISLTNQYGDYVPTISLIEQTNAHVQDQGYTYNQTGFTYNQTGVLYGGLYNQNQDIAPLIFSVATPTPHFAGFVDIYTAKTAPSHGTITVGQPLAPGFFLYVTYPVTLTW